MSSQLSTETISRLAGSAHQPQSMKRKRRSDLFPQFSASKRKVEAENSLRDFLKKKSRCQAFRAFLTKEFSEENLDFWVEVESFRKQKQTKQSKTAQFIYETFVQQGAKREVNIDEPARRAVEANLFNPNRSTFDFAQKQVEKLMEKDSFRRFLGQGWSFAGDKKAPSSGKRNLVIKSSRSFSKFRSTLRSSIVERQRRRSVASA